MTDSLIIRVPEQEEAHASWLLVDSAGGDAHTPQAGPLSLASRIAAGRRVIALVPGVEVLLAEPQLPVRSGARLAQLVPFALEEQLAEDVESMHFAIGRRDAAREGTPVAAVSRARFESWLGRLRAAQIEPDAIHADSTALPSNPGQTVLLVDADRLYVRHPDQPPVVLNAEPFAEALELAGLGSAMDEASRHAIAYVTQDDWRSHQAAFDALRERIASLKVQLLPHGALPLLARELLANPPIDLLQGPYARKTPMSDRWRHWRLVAVLLAGLVTLDLLGKGVDIWRLNQEERALNAAIEQVFREAMPGEQNAVDARRRMEARLAAVRGTGGSGQNGLLYVMAVLGSAFSQVPDTTIEALSYRGNVLDLKVAAKDVSSLDRLQNLVVQRGLQAELQSSNARESGIEGRIQIRSQVDTPITRRTAGQGTGQNANGDIEERG